MRTAILSVCLAGLLCNGLGAQEIKSKLAAEKVDADATSLKVNASGEDLTAILETLVERTPDLTSLSIHHFSNKIELRSLTLLADFKKLENFTLTGDPFLYDDEFEALGSLSKLKSLRMALPWPSFTDARLASLGGLKSLEELDMTGCRGNPRELERKIWEAIGKDTAEITADQLEAKADKLSKQAEELLKKAEELKNEAAALKEKAAKLRDADNNEEE